jgi:hypothetical protein
MNGKITYTDVRYQKKVLFLMSTKIFYEVEIITRSIISAKSNILIQPKVMITWENIEEIKI